MANKILHTTSWSLITAPVAFNCLIISSNSARKVSQFSFSFNFMFINFFLNNYCRSIPFFSYLSFKLFHVLNVVSLSLMMSICVSFKHTYINFPFFNVISLAFSFGKSTLNSFSKHLITSFSYYSKKLDYMSCQAFNLFSNVESHSKFYEKLTEPS